MDQRFDSDAESVAETLASVTEIYHRAVEGDSVAEAEIWEAYARRLQGLARKGSTYSGS